ncbi:MAG: adenylate/guanylate cyclase domain-containing protein [Burkholderiales bacterium]|nr:adenylate/guanylate cyclase domain-containing protein [Burkholderiales bacterium]
MRKHLARIVLGLAVLALFVGHAAKFYQFELVNRLDHIIYDARLRFTMPGGVDERIVILDIDEKSLAAPELGRWPWGRDKVAALVDKLFDEYGIAALGFDVVNAEPDASSGLPVLERLADGELKGNAEFQAALARLRPALDHDARFARAIKGRPVVLGYYFTSEAEAQSREAHGAIPAPVLPAGTFAGRTIPFTSWAGYGGNLPAFQAAAAAAGHFNPVVDEDGVVRRVPMLAQYQGRYYEPLALALVRMLLDFPPVEPGYPPDRFMSRTYSGLEWLAVGKLRVPVDENAAALVPFRGDARSFPYLSLVDVFLDRVPAERLRGRIALVGTSAPGLVDLRATPVNRAYPGVEVHANLIAGMLDGTIKGRPAYVLGAEVVLLLAGGLALAVLLPLLSPLRATLAAGAALAGYAGLNLGVWQTADIALPLASSLLMTVAMFALNMSYGYFVESRAKRQFTELFGQYVPPELVDQMARDPGKYSMEGRSEELTVLFSDIRGFTSIAEGMEPKELSQLLNEYLTEMTRVIGEHRGTLDKYIGDAIMAFWGAPVAEPRHAERAVAAAVAMQAALGPLNERFRARGWPDLKIGIGINTGPMRVGDMGSRSRKAYTVLGDAVNLASRLEGLTKQYGVGIIVGEATRQAVGGTVFRELDRVRVKGKDAPTAIYEPVGPEGAVGKPRVEELRLWQQALKAYRAGDWDQAELALFNMQRLYPKMPLYEVYAGRVARLRAQPPAGRWDGVTTFEEK